MAERRRGSWHHGERKRATISGKGWNSGSPLRPAWSRAGSGGGAAAVADTARPRIRDSLTHHTCSGNSLRWLPAVAYMWCARLFANSVCLFGNTHTTRGEAGVWSVLVQPCQLYFANWLKHLGPDVRPVPPGECLADFYVLAMSLSTAGTTIFPLMLEKYRNCNQLCNGITTMHRRTNSD